MRKGRKLKDRDLRKLATYFIGEAARNFIERGTFWHDEAVATLGGTDADVLALEEHILRLARQISDRGSSAQELEKHLTNPPTAAHPRP